ncbi:MAG TPA: TfoX/Sxy family protein [Parvularculaceae bacterium]|nr:TfoX/Sxy family protein [Parvularculaceae bacterium]
MSDRRKNISQLRNLGPKTERMLSEVVFFDADTLAAIGAVEAYRRLRFAGGGVSLNALYVMEAALRDIDWRALEPREKAELRRRAGA